MPEGKASTNTFIEAARRMSQRQTVQAAPPPASNSLIGRALSRFQSNDKAAAPKAEAAAAVPKTKAERKPRVLAGDKPARAASAPEPVVSLEPQVRDEGPKAKADGQPSFLARNRRTILLAALVLAVSLLAANLVLQRMQPEATAEPGPITTGAASSSAASTIFPISVMASSQSEWTYIRPSCRYRHASAIPHTCSAYN